MPITTFQTILSTDKLQSGFRAKINADIALLITDIVDNGDATATAELQGGTDFQIDLGVSFYTKAQVQALITAIDPAVWGAITGNVEDQTDVVGNLGVISGIDAILISANFAVASGDVDNPFGAFAASGYASFSVPSVNGWQLLIKEDNATQIKFRTYSGGVWHDWVTIGNFSIPRIKIDINTPIPYFIDVALYPTLTPSVNVICKILWALDTSNKTLARWPMQVTEVYSTTGLTTFLGFNVYGNDNGSGAFNEDTWVDFG